MKGVPMAPNAPRGEGSERGIALVMALMVLVAMSLLSVLLLVSLNVETKIAGFSARRSHALNVAEAGVAEAMARIRNGDIPNPANPNPRQVAQIFLTVPGSVPAVGADTIPMATGQPAGAWLPYSKAVRDSDVLTVRYKTDTNTPPTLVYRYDPALNPPVQPNTGFPIFVITAAGRRGNEVRRVQTEVIQRPFKIRVEAAMATEKGVDFSGNAKICGMNHRLDTPAYTDGVHGTGPCSAWGVVSGGDLPGSWSEESVSSSGSAEQAGQPVQNKDNQGTGFYAGPWEALGLSQAEFYSWAGAPQAIPPAPPNGVVYLDNNATTQDQSGTFAYDGGNGEGLLYVDGDLSINGNFTFRGMIYVEGDLKINGNAWILGALVVRGKGRIKIANGSCVVLYSRDSVALNLAKYGGQFMTLSWHER